MRLFKSGRKHGRAASAGFRAQPETKPTMGLTSRRELPIIALTFAVLVIAVTRAPEFSRKSLRVDMDPQRVSMEEICSEISFKTTDIQATELAREIEAAKIPDTYRIDTERVARQLRLLDERIDALAAKGDEVDAAVRTALKASNSSMDPWDIVTRAVADFAARLKDDPAYKSYPDTNALAVWLMPKRESVPQRQFKNPPRNNPTAALPVTGFKEPEKTPLEFEYADDLAKLCRENTHYVLSNGIIKPDLPELEARRPINVVRDNPAGDQKASDVLPLNKVPTPKTAIEVLSGRLAESAQALLNKDTGRRPDWAKLQMAALEMARPLITDTLSFDQVYSEKARGLARLAVQPVMKEVRPGEVLQPSHHRWTPQSILDVKTYLEIIQPDRKPSGRLLAILLAQVLFVAIIMGGMVRSVRFLTRYRERQHMLRNLNVAFLIMCGTLALGRLVSYFEPTGLVLPATAGAILLAILINPRIAVMASFLTAALLSIQFNYDWRLLFVTGAMTLAGIYSTYRVRRRGDMAKAALKATGIGVAAIVAITLAMDSITSLDAGRRILLVLLNGGACFLIVPALLSPLERLFNITTDIQLLEYSDLNNDLMKRMAIEMPATYAHCLMVGQLAEAAAEAIGANGLLARVIAYYHDIGKLRRPEYYSENQHGPNIHDELSPRLSARAIACHVTCGEEVAREYHLPEAIIEGIRQHHGTTLIGFFHQKAIDQNKHDAIREEDFRYPGPKPQSRETAIIMICDAVESGIRSIKNPNEDRVHDFVDKMINGRSMDRQFDEAPLTLKDLDVIKEAVTRRMVTALHPRVAYPSERLPEKKADNVIPISGGAQ